MTNIHMDNIKVIVKEAGVDMMDVFDRASKKYKLDNTEELALFFTTVQDVVSFIIIENFDNATRKIIVGEFYKAILEQIGEKK